MIIKTGNIVSHSGALDWGSGKVVEVTASMATIQFSDGKSRKIASSHFGILSPAVTASYVPPPDPEPVVKKTRARTTGKKVPSPKN